MTDRILIGLLTTTVGALAAAGWASGEFQHRIHQYRRWRKERARKGLVSG